MFDKTEELCYYTFPEERDDIMQHDFKKQKKFDDAFFTDKMTQTLAGTLALIGILGTMYATKNDTKSGALEEPTETTIQTHKYPIREHYRKITTYENHVVRVGDNLTMIAEKYNTTVEKILAANSNITNPNIIQPGDILTIPIEKIIVLPEKRLQENLMRGIDISHYQGNIDWDKIEASYKNGDISYIIIRICENVNDNMEREFTLDERFEEYLSECNKRGIPYGVYAFSRGTTAEELDKETTSLINYIKNNLNQQKGDLDLTFAPSLPIYMDCFDDTFGAQYKLMAEGKYDECVNIIDYWCKAMENAGYFTGVYINNGHYNKLIQDEERANILNQYSVWVAEYPTTKAIDVKNITKLTVPFINTIFAQQISSNGRVDGIDGPVDVNLISGAVLNNVTSFYRNKPNNKVKRRIRN